MEQLITSSSIKGTLEAYASLQFRTKAQHVALFACAFILLEYFLLHGPPRALLRRMFATNPALSPKEVDATLPPATERLTGLVHLLIQLPLALYVLSCADLAADPLYAGNAAGQLMLEISAGYFLFDLWVCFSRDEGIQYLVHGFVCSLLFNFGAFSTWLQYFGAVFLMWELSTPFVYVRWFLYKMGKDGSRLYFLNGLCMITSFALARNVFGLWKSVQFMRAAAVELAAPRLNGIPAVVLVGYCVGNLCLNTLNYVWLYKMLAAALHFGKTGKMPSVKQE